MIFANCFLKVPAEPIYFISIYQLQGIEDTNIINASILLYNLYRTY